MTYYTRVVVDVPAQAAPDASYLPPRDAEFAVRGPVISASDIAT
jgi:hypothetical protein